MTNITLFKKKKYKYKNLKYYYYYYLKKDRKKRRKGEKATSFGKGGRRAPQRITVVSENQGFT
jgi:hypothetical protein